jgi:hypothetical protein
MSMPCDYGLCDPSRCSEAEHCGALPSVQFVYANGEPFAKVYEAIAAFGLWNARRWDLVIKGVKYARDDFSGYCAMESVFNSLQN